MKTTNNRLAKLREAKDIVAELGDAIDGMDPRIQRMKGDIESAGGSIRSAGFTRHMEDAMGRAAGMAVANDLDHLADRATRILDDDIELSSEPVATIDGTTDDRGRLTLGSEFADRAVEVAVLSAEIPDDVGDDA
jgi:hypothetical protein